MLNETLNWNAKKAQAETMSTEALIGAIVDIQETLPHADELDRELGTDRGGYYRDEASVLWAELNGREEPIANDPSRKGQKASATEPAGAEGAFEVYAVFTRFDAVEWFVERAEDGEIVGQCRTRFQALVTAECLS